MEKEMIKLADKVQQCGSTIVTKTDAELRAMVKSFKARLNKGETLDSLLPEAFAVAKEAIKRVFKYEIKQEQIIAGIGLHTGRIVEVTDSKDKQAPRLMAAYLNSLTGKGVHILATNNSEVVDANGRKEVITNDDGCKKLMEQDQPFYAFLGTTIGLCKTNAPKKEKQKAYNSDITYTTANEVGFDLIRDGIAIKSEDRVVRELSYAISNDAISTIIDNARTPLILNMKTKDGQEKIVGRLTMAMVFFLYAKKSGLITTGQNHKSAIKKLYAIDSMSVIQKANNKTEDEEKSDALAFAVQYDSILNLKQVAIFEERASILDEGTAYERVLAALSANNKKAYLEKRDRLTKEGFNFAQLETDLYLSIIDEEWVNFITDMTKKSTEAKMAQEFYELVETQYKSMCEGIKRRAADFLLKIQIEKKK